MSRDARFTRLARMILRTLLEEVRRATRCADCRLGLGAPSHERVPAPSPPRHHNTRPLMPTVNPSTRTTKTRSGTPIRHCPPPPFLRRMARCHAPPPLLRPMARPPSQRPSRRSFNRRRCLARSPMWHRSRRCVGGCGTNPIVRPPLRLSMRGLYGAVSHVYDDPWSRLPNFLHLGGPPCVFTGSAGDRRDAGRSAPSRNGRNWRRCHGGAAGCCARCSPRVLLLHL